MSSFSRIASPNGLCEQSGRGALCAPLVTAPIGLLHLSMMGSRHDRIHFLYAAYFPELGTF